MHYKKILCGTLFSIFIGFAALAQQPVDRQFHLQGDTVSLHFSVVKYFPFIDAKINGVQGKLMFDTGNQDALSLNEHLLPLKNGKTIGKGFVGSGQSFEVHRYDSIPEINLDGKIIRQNAGPVRGSNMNFLENILPDVIGQVGYNFFSGYLFKMDYDKGLITFYKNSPTRQQSKDFLKGEKVLAVLDFEIRKLPNHPVIKLNLPNDSLAIAFDTGQLGGVYLDDNTKARWMADGRLTPAAQGRFAELKGLEVTKGFKISLDQTYLFPPANAAGANQAIGITEKNTIALGYSFLKQFKTIWDFEAHKIYLLTRG